MEDGEESLGLAGKLVLPIKRAPGGVRLLQAITGYYSLLRANFFRLKSRQPKGANVSPFVGFYRLLSHPGNIFFAAALGR
jgi:hypothetical protein